MLVFVDDQFGNVGFVGVVFLILVDQYNYIGIGFDLFGVVQVVFGWVFVVLCFWFMVELCQYYYGYVEFFGQVFQVFIDFGYYVVVVCVMLFVFDQIDVVDGNYFQVVFVFYCLVDLVDVLECQ